jgi:hypothetical protein
MIASNLISIASAEIGVTEVAGTNCGPRVNEYKGATVGLDPSIGWPWCAAFVCWCVREAMKTGGPYTFHRPTTAGAFAFEAWSLAQDNSTQTKKNPRASDIAPGDIVIFRFSHIGIATSKADTDGDFKTVEGNTDKEGSREGGGVFAKWRNVSQVKTRIRFTV